MVKDTFVKIYLKIIMLEQFSYIIDDSIYNNIMICSNDSSKEKIDEVMTLLNIEHIKHKIAGNCGKFLSGGEIKKVGLGRAMLSDAKLIILDEPSNTLDKNSRDNMKSYLEKTNKTVILISHEETVNYNFKSFNI